MLRSLVFSNGGSEKGRIERHTGDGALALLLRSGMVGSSHIVWEKVDGEERRMGQAGTRKR